MWTWAVTYGSLQAKRPKEEEDGMLIFPNKWWVTFDILTSTVSKYRLIINLKVLYNL